MSYRVEIVQFVAAEVAIKTVREAVFVQEQQVPAELEWDGLDEQSSHVVVWDEMSQPIGTGRLTPDDKIGRMAVLKNWRGRGVGSAILRDLVELASRQGRSSLSLHAQTHAMTFYERHGFTAVGEEFEEAGISHRRMVLLWPERFPNLC